MSIYRRNDETLFFSPPAPPHLATLNDFPSFIYTRNSKKKTVQSSSVIDNLFYSKRYQIQPPIHLISRWLTLEQK